MKKSLVILETLLQEKYTYGKDYAFLLNVHDEFQLEVLPEFAEDVGKLCVQAMTDAGKQLNFKCPITGEYKIGESWKETH